MKTARLLLSIAVAASFVGGCGDDGGPSTEPDAGPPPIDQCQNPADLSIVEVLAPDGGVGDAGLGRIVDQYVYPCIGEPGTPCYPLLLDDAVTDEEMAACISTCTTGSPAEGLSQGCVLCYAEMADCVLAECLAPCLGGNGQACADCFNAACTPRLRTCTGIP